MPDREYWINISYEDYFKHKMIAHKWKIKKFADKTSKAFEAITGIKYYSLSREEKERIRPLYVKFAEGCKEIFGEDVWINASMSDYKSDRCEHYGNCLCGSGTFADGTKGLAHCETQIPNWIITDMRFPNELKAVKDRGGFTIRVNRLYENPCKNILFDEHESETALDNAEFDEIVDNSGTIEELIEQIKQILIKRKII